MLMFFILNLSLRVDILDSRLFRLLFEKLPSQLSGQGRENKLKDKNIPGSLPSPEKLKKSNNQGILKGGVSLYH
jgi:hypothetical protein